MPVPKISIIIPVYNAALHIEQCVRSVLNQTMQEIEVIAVNDGSTDDSGNILDALAAADQRLQVIHQENKGVSAARNQALQRSTGIYTAFADADDYMEPDMLQELYQAVITTDSDWAICNVMAIEEGREPAKRLHLTDEVIDITNSRHIFLHGLMRFNYDNANWNKLYSTSVIQLNQLRFAEDMTIWEDLLFNLQYLQYVSKVAIVARPLYNYRILRTALFSGQTKDLIPQFNKLYKYYLEFAAAKAGSFETEAFKTEMSRITYSQLLHKAEVKVVKEQKGFFSVLSAYSRELKRIDPSIFYFPARERKGVQGIKKQLLQNRQFGLFACIIAARQQLRK
ncbi:MAG: glycosyltransferase [Lacibacter sp.]